MYKRHCPRSGPWVEAEVQSNSFPPPPFILTFEQRLVACRIIHSFFQITSITLHHSHSFSLGPTTKIYSKRQINSNEMARYSTVALAFALGASAAPHWPGWGGNHGSSQGGPSGYGVSPAGPSGGASKGFPSFPVPSAPVPTGSAGGAGPSGGSPRPPPFSYSQIANATAPVYVGAATASSASFSVSYFPTASASGNSSAPAPTSAPKVLSTGGGAVSGGDLPVASGTTTFNAVQTIAAGGSFDGGMAQFGRGVTCTGQVEGGTSDAVFMIEDGGSLSNVIIGPDQIEGVHCYGSCTLTNVWWAAVCEDAFSIKEQADGATTTISGGGAFGATDKVFQHNGGGTLSVSGFTVDTFGKLYRSCG